MPKHYNLTKVNEIAGGDKKFVSVVVAIFLEEIPPDLLSLKNAIANNNHHMAHQYTHKMKPNFEMFGINLSSQVTKIEQWSETTKAASIIQLQLEEIADTLAIVVKELQEDF